MSWRIALFYLLGGLIAWLAYRWGYDAGARDGMRRIMDDARRRDAERRSIVQALRNAGISD